MANNIKWAQFTQVSDIWIKMENWERYQDPQPSGCIHWTGGKHNQGYAMIGAIRVSDHKRLMVTGHRVAMRMQLGRAITPDETVVHSCSNTQCVNPNHLLLGDLRLRNLIMYANGRGPNQGLPRPRLEAIKQQRDYRYTEEEIQWVRTASTPDIVARFQVTKDRAAHLRWSFRNGYRWLPMPETK
jgi:hypothetical protein